VTYVSVQKNTLLIGPGLSRNTLEDEHLDSSQDLLFVRTKRFLIWFSGSNVYLLTQFRAEGVERHQRAVAHEAHALPPAQLSTWAQVRPPAARPPARRFWADGDGRRLRRPATHLPGVYICRLAPGDGVCCSGNGVRPNRPLQPPQSDRSGPLPPASTATATTDRPPLPTRRGGGPHLAAHGGRAFAAAQCGPHCARPPGRRPTSHTTPSTATAGTRRAQPPHNACRHESGAGRQRPGSRGLAVAVASFSPSLPAARGERARLTPRLPTHWTQKRHYTSYFPAPQNTSSRATRTPTTAPNTPPHRTTQVAAPSTARHPATPAAATTARAPLHPVLARNPPHQPPAGTHAYNRTLQSLAPHHASRRTQHSPAPHHARRHTDRTPATARSARAPRQTQIPTTSDSPCPPAAADTVPAGTGWSRRAGHSDRPPSTATPPPHQQGPNPLTWPPRCLLQQTQIGGGPQPAHQVGKKKPTQRGKKPRYMLTLSCTTSC